MVQSAKKVGGAILGAKTASLAANAAAARRNCIDLGQAAFRCDKQPRCESPRASNAAHWLAIDPLGDSQ